MKSMQLIDFSLIKVSLSAVAKVPEVGIAGRPNSETESLDEEID